VVERQADTQKVSFQRTNRHRATISQEKVDHQDAQRSAAQGGGWAFAVGYEGSKVV